jgi:hypothetical protein
MSWDIYITHPELPDPNEPIISIGTGPSAFPGAIKDKTGVDPKDWQPDFAITELKWFIAECDKRDKGQFNNLWCVALKDREADADWDKYCHFLSRTHSYTTWIGQTIRSRMREAAMRFLLYYVAGYEIKYEW